MNQIKDKPGKYGSIKSEPALKPLDIFKGARDSSVPQNRLDEVRARARKLREQMLAGPKAAYYKTGTLVNVPYPTRYAFTGAFTQSMVTPIIHITNRLFIIQFNSTAGLKTMLFSPSDIMANAETRFFKRFGGGMLMKGEGAAAQMLKDVAQKVVAPIGATVEEWLQKVGLAPEQVDYIAYDHLHTQDIRNWLGVGDQPGYFPNAKLLIMKQEWESAQGLLPPQQDWYCPNGVENVNPSRIVLLDGDTLLGDGVAFVSTPGHTEGNHSLVVHTDDGLFVTSENGVAPEVYAPLNSSINEIREYAAKTGMEVILNGNTQEGGLDQYISMVMEKEIAGPSKANADFPNMMCSSQFSSYWMFPGIKPTFGFDDLEFGTLQT